MHWSKRHLSFPQKVKEATAPPVKLSRPVSFLLWTRQIRFPDGAWEPPACLREVLAGADRDDPH